MKAAARDPSVLKPFGKSITSHTINRFITPSILEPTSQSGVKNCHSKSLEKVTINTSHC